MKRVFEVTVFEDGFKRREDYVRLATAYGGNPERSMLNLRGTAEDLPNLLAEFAALGFIQIKNARDEGENRFAVLWEVAFEPEDYERAEAYVFSGTDYYLAENVKATSRHEVIMDLSDEGLWEVKDETQELLFGDGPALFSGWDGLRYANESLRQAIQSSGLKGFDFLDTVKLTGENVVRVKQKLYVVSSTMQLHPVEPDVLFQEDGGESQVRPAGELVGFRRWCGETVLKYRRSELDRAGFVDFGEMQERIGRKACLNGLIMSRRAKEVIASFGIRQDEFAWPVMVV